YLSPCPRLHRARPPFPTRRSSDLRGTLNENHLLAVIRVALRAHGFTASPSDLRRTIEERQRLGIWVRDQVLPERFPENLISNPEDRKSTRLNSSHQIISYAVFCLK